MNHAAATRAVGGNSAATGRARVVVVDMAVAPDSPAGSCVLAEVEGLAQRFDVTVFSDRFEPGALSGVAFVRVRAPERPVLLRYVAFHLGVPMHYLLWRLRGGRAACVQATQGQLPGAAICYAHFCHRGYLQRHWRASTATGARRWARFAVHLFNTWYEAAALRRARVVVVPSLGLSRELAATYPACAAKLRVLANPVATAYFRSPADFDRSAQRADLGFEPGQLVLGFMALGDFARKGLGLLLQALAVCEPTQRATLRVMVVGGQAGEIAEFRALAEGLGVATCVRFVGLKTDVRPYLWACDAFAFPSAYEIFSLAVIQAAAAGLPVLVCHGVYGSEEFVVDGHNGWSIERDLASISAWFARLIAQRDDLPRMGAAAAESVRCYDRAAFQARWVALIGEVLADTDAGADAGAEPTPQPNPL